MRVLVTTDTLGGVWTYTRELVTGLLKQGVEITLVSFGNIPSEQQTKWMEGLDGLDFRATAFRLEWMQDSGADLKASASYLEALIAETQPDVLHLNQYCYGTLKTCIPKIVVAHSDVVGWFQAVHGREKDSKWVRQYRALVTEGLQDANVVVAPSAWMLRSLLANYLVPAATRVIHNGRSPGLFNPLVSKDDFAVSVGRVWDLGKNAVLLTQIQPPAMVYLAGENTNPESGSNLPTHNGRRLVFRGVLNENQLQHLLSRAVIYVATSQYEPFGLALVEAALSRCAILAADIPSFRELWGESVRYFENNNAASLEHELWQLHADRELCLTYGKLAQEHALRHYRASQMVNNYQQLYRSLVAREEALAA